MSLFTSDNIKSRNHNQTQVLLKIKPSDELLDKLYHILCRHSGIVNIREINEGNTRYKLLFYELKEIFNFYRLDRVDESDAHLTFKDFDDELKRLISNYEDSSKFDFTSYRNGNDKDRFNDIYHKILSVYNQYSGNKTWM